MGGAVLVIGLVVFGVVKMMRGGKRGASAETQTALPAVDTYAGLPPGPQEWQLAIGEPSRLPALMPSRTEVLLTSCRKTAATIPKPGPIFCGVGWPKRKQTNGVHALLLKAT